MKGCLQSVDVTPGVNLNLHEEVGKLGKGEQKSNLNLRISRFFYYLRELKVSKETAMFGVIYKIPFNVWQP